MDAARLAAAPIPAAAVLSGAGVKAGVIGLIRFLPLGARSRLGRGARRRRLRLRLLRRRVGVTQQNPKTILAYSSVSQMGVIAAALGHGLAPATLRAGAGRASTRRNHVLVKGALFLAVGAFARATTRPAVRSLPAARSR